MGTAHATQTAVGQIKSYKGNEMVEGGRGVTQGNLVWFVPSPLPPSLPPSLAVTPWNRSINIITINSNINANNTTFYVKSIISAVALFRTDIYVKARDIIEEDMQEEHI